MSFRTVRAGVVRSSEGLIWHSGAAGVLLDVAGG